MKQRLATVFDWTKAQGHYPHENPVTSVKKALPTVKRKVHHMAALAWQDLPAFIVDLRQKEGVSARTLEFLILTATRSGEARLARWAEIEGDVWAIPGERMKRGTAHRIPLSPEAAEVLEQVRGLDSDLIFPTIAQYRRSEKKPQTVNVFRALFDRMGRQGITTHGFRSTFRDWCSECAHAEREVAEAALSHATGNKVERAYARSDLFERRRTLMEAWGHFSTGKVGEVVRMVRS